jgi:hypothetical protein
MVRARGWPTSRSASLAKGFYYNPACQTKPRRPTTLLWSFVG